MILNVLVVLLVIAITLLWGMRGKGRGLFSSFLTCVCVLISGAVAFGLWETLVYKYLLSVNEDMAWGLGLLLPFCVTLVVTRLVAEAAVPKNLDFGDVPNFVGGAVFGLVSAVVTVGILVLSLSYFRFGPALLGYKPVADKSGNLIYERHLWVPVDEITVKLYEHLSGGAFATSTPLAQRMPRLYEQAAMQRMVYVDSGDDKLIARNSIQGGQFEIKGRYEIGPDAADRLATYEIIDANGNPEERRQTVLDTDGDKITGTARIEGFVVQFKAGAGEKSGQVVIGPAQVSLIVSGAGRGGRATVLHPFSIVATPEAGSGRMHRFPMNSDDLFISSVGGASTSYFSFEFLVPDGAEAQDLIIKNYRVPVSKMPAQSSEQYASWADRDEAIKSGDLFQSFGITIGGINPKDINRSESIAIQPNSRGSFDEIVTNSLIPESWVVATTTGTKGLEITDDDRDRYIAAGRATFTEEDLKQKGLDRKLRVDRFASKRDTTIVQVRVKSKGEPTRLGRALQTADVDGPPQLLDSKNRVYEAIGWVYGDSGTVNIRFTPGDPVKGLSELPSSLSDTKRDQTLYFIFEPTHDIEIVGFLLGKTQIASFTGGKRVG